MNWFTIFESEEEAKKVLLQNNPITVIVNDKRLCLGIFQGLFYTIDDTCPHQNASLGKGKILPYGGIQCPFHHFVFDIKTGKCTSGSCKDVTRYDTRSSNNKVKILC